MSKEKIKGLMKHKNAVPLFLVIAGILIVGIFLLIKSLGEISTDDAFIEGHIIPISSKVPGYVMKINVSENQPVKAGDNLILIDDKDYTIKVKAAQADLKAAQAELEQAQQDAGRFKNLFTTGDVSQQQLDKAVLRVNIAYAQTLAKQALLEQAELNLAYTKIITPSDGQVTRKSTEEGAYLQPGQVIMAIVPYERWVVANLKETQLTNIKPGQKVTIKIDAYPKTTLHGHVDSIQKGTGSKFSLLPAENATGNFIKVVQRVPVKILIDDQIDPNTPLAIGMSVVPTIKIK
ncbi:MAG: HlyD family secretion protein [Candidatus Omnitrophica bacterium]|nr:HlyD family secretion protein [Candidatus Omnitrophota bacterium]